MNQRRGATMRPCNSPSSPQTRDSSKPVLLLPRESQGGIFRIFPTGPLSQPPLWVVTARKCRLGAKLSASPPMPFYNLACDTERLCTCFGDNEGNAMLLCDRLLGDVKCVRLCANQPLQSQTGVDLGSSHVRRTEQTKYARVKLRSSRSRAVRIA